MAKPEESIMLPSMPNLRVLGKQTRLRARFLSRELMFALSISSLKHKEERIRKTVGEVI